VNLNLGIDLRGFPLFAGQYSDFSVAWYRDMGSTIVRYEMVKCIGNDDDNEHNKSSHLDCAFSLLSGVEEVQGQKLDL